MNRPPEEGLEADPSSTSRSVLKKSLPYASIVAAVVSLTASRARIEFNNSTLTTDSSGEETRIINTPLNDVVGFDIRQKGRNFKSKKPTVETFEVRDSHANDTHSSWHQPDTLKEKIFSYLPNIDLWLNRVLAAWAATGLFQIHRRAKRLKKTTISTEEYTKPYGLTNSMLVVGQGAAIVIQLPTPPTSAIDAIIRSLHEDDAAEFLHDAQKHDNPYLSDEEISAQAHEYMKNARQYKDTGDEAVGFARERARTLLYLYAAGHFLKKRLSQWSSKESAQRDKEILQRIQELIPIPDLFDSSR